MTFIHDYPQAELVPGLVVYRYDAPLCFANAEDFRRRALQAVDQYPQPVEWFVLNAEANVEIDMTALDALDQLRADLEGVGSFSRWHASSRIYVTHWRRAAC